MRNQWISLPMGLALTAILSACSLVTPGEQTVPPPPPAAVVPHAVATDTPTPAPGGKVGPGEIVFVSEGRLVAISPDGSNGRVIYAPGEGAVLHDLAVSPDGHYLAFTVSAETLMVLDLVQGRVDKIESSSTDRFSAPVWTLASDALYYHHMVIGSNSKPAESLVMRADMPPGSAPQKVLDFDLASNMPIFPAAAWRGGLLLLHQADLGGGSLGQWIVFDPTAQSLTPLLKDFGLWDVSPDRTQLLLFNTADLTGGPASPSVPVFSATLDLLKGAVGVTRLTPEDQQLHIEAARFGPDGAHIAALQYVSANGAVRRKAVLLSPGAGGKYTLALISPDDTADDVSVIWGGTGLIVERLRGGQSELWQVPLDGSAGALLINGEQPLVVPPR